MLTIETLATWENLPALNDFADRAERTLPLSEEQSFILRLVVEEIATNIIKYGYPTGPGPIALSVGYASETMNLEIRDRGQPFDPREAALPDLTSDVERREVGGLGVFLVLDMVDTIDYRHDDASNWNRLTITKRARPHTLFELLRQVSLFNGFDDVALEALTAIAEERPLPVGEVLFQEGDAGYNCFVLLHGRLQVIKRLGSDEVVLDTVQPGSIIGEMALIDRSPRSATIRAGADCRLLVLDENAFYDLMHNNPAAALDLLRGGTKRLRDTNQRMIAGMELKNAELSRAYEDLKAAQADQLRLERIRQELEVARRIQEVFWPRGIPQPPGWQLAARNRGAQEVGGDFYDVIPLPPVMAGSAGVPYIGLVIADVCGKGVPAALFVALTRSLLRAASQWAPLDEPHTIVERALRLTNDYIAVEHAPSNMFITLCYGILDAATSTFHYVNAGHNPPLLIRADGSVEQLVADTIPLGILNNQRYQARSVAIDPGDLLVCFTDGVTEAFNPANEEFGDQRLVTLLRTVLPQGAAAAIQAIEQAVDSFAAGAPQADDITLLAVSRALR